MTDITSLRIAAGLAACAFNDAQTEPCGTASIALTVMQNNEGLLRHTCFERRTTEVILDQMDRAIDKLRLVGYLTSGE